MVVAAFPPVEEADEHGLLAIGGDLEPDTLLLAYRRGIFPWPLDDETLAWFSPPQRSILVHDELRVNRSLQRARKREQFSFSIDRSFRQVMQECQRARRPGQRGTWITNEMVAAYTTFHELGYAHSFECWLNDRLVGGVYGVRLGGFFAGESMFHLEDDASKLTLWFLLESLKESGISWIDTQVLNPFLESLGAREIPREAFLKMAQSAINAQCADPRAASGWPLLP